MHILTPDNIKEKLVSKIKEAEAKYNKENPCLHCGPGNGCDDCRGCEDSKKNFELSKIRRAAYDEYERTFGHSYLQDRDYEQIIKKEEEYNKWIDYCKKCGGNFDDDCRDCKDWNKKFEVINSLKWLKEEFKRNYNIDYTDFGKQIKNLNIMNDNLKVNDGMSINEWIEDGINGQGAKHFYDDVNNNWTFISDSVKQCILKQISKKIKPEKIDTIEDLAKVLDGNNYGNELDNDLKISIEQLCVKNNWMVVFPYSDDCLELRGKFDDEFGAWDGTYIKLVKRGNFYLDDCDEYGDDDATYKKAASDMFTTISDKELEDLKKTDYKDTCVIEALWNPEEIDASWQINVAGAPFAKFNIYEDDELNAECAVVDLNKFYV